MSVEHADLHCETCDRVTEHELHYAGRLLESTRCTICGTHLDVPSSATCCRRTSPTWSSGWSASRRGCCGGPRATGRRSSVGLPRAIARQPAKFLEELRSIFRR